VTLEAIAEQTKVSVGLLDGLERGDLSRWPGGIFRRAFVRGYAEVVGLDASSVVETFVRVCPEQGTPPPVERIVAHQFGGPRPLLRLTLAEEEAHTFYVVTRRRLAEAAIDLAAVGLPALAAALFVGSVTGWAILGSVGILYHLAGSLLAGSTPAAWLLSRQARRTSSQAERPRDAPGEGVATTERDDTQEPADGARRAPAEVFFTPRRRRQGTRPYPRRSPDSRAARR
jgi:hypothetical protein